jgi:uncharacterized protein GlcG (DUF336 family)
MITIATELRIGLDWALAHASAAFGEARHAELAPLALVVIDAGGHVILMQRQDGASTLRCKIAHGKAAGAIGLGVSSRAKGAIAQDRPRLFASLLPLAPDGMVAAAGGLLVCDETDRVIGAVGISGDTSDNDEHCARVGIEAVALHTPA